MQAKESLKENSPWVAMGVGYWILDMDGRAFSVEVALYIARAAMTMTLSWWWWLVLLCKSFTTHDDQISYYKIEIFYNPQKKKKQEYYIYTQNYIGYV